MHNSNVIIYLIIGVLAVLLYCYASKRAAEKESQRQAEMLRLKEERRVLELIEQRKKEILNLYNAHAKLLGECIAVLQTTSDPAAYFDSWEMVDAHSRAIKVLAVEHPQLITKNFEQAIQIVHANKSSLTEMLIERFWVVAQFEIDALCLPVARARRVLRFKEVLFLYNAQLQPNHRSRVQALIAYASQQYGLLPLHFEKALPPNRIA